MQLSVLIYRTMTRSSRATCTCGITCYSSSQRNRVTAVKMWPILYKWVITFASSCLDPDTQIRVSVLVQHCADLDFCRINYDLIHAWRTTTLPSNSSRIIIERPLLDQNICPGLTVKSLIIATCRHPFTRINWSASEWSLRNLHLYMSGHQSALDCLFPDPS